jgi:hypothetical protein
MVRLVADRYGQPVAPQYKVCREARIGSHSCRSRSERRHPAPAGRRPHSSAVAGRILSGRGASLPHSGASGVVEHDDPQTPWIWAASSRDPYGTAEIHQLFPTMMKNKAASIHIPRHRRARLGLGDWPRSGADGAISTLSRCRAGPTPAKMRFSCDSPLEGAGFEPSVPRWEGRIFGDV